MATTPMNAARLLLAIGAACLFQGAAAGQTKDQRGPASLAMIENDSPASGVAADPAPAANAPRKPANAPVRIGNPLWAIPVRELTATRDRPLFSPSRRPPVPVIAAAPAPPPAAPPPRPAEPERPPLILVGTIIGANERIAIFVNQISNETTRLREGEQDLGWIVRAIDARATVLEKGNRAVTLELPRRDTHPSQQSAPIPAPGVNPGIELTL